MTSRLYFLIQLGHNLWASVNGTPTRAGGPTNAAIAVEVLHALQPAALFWALARVICAYLDYLRSRKVIITTRDSTVIHAEGLSRSDVERLIARTRGDDRDENRDRGSRSGQL
jgi:hypothetical protein